MKTPMQEMLEWVRATLPMDLDWPRMIEEKVESLIEQEREEVKNNYIVGYLDNGYYEGAEEDAAQLWEKTYGFIYNENTKNK